MPMRSSNWTMGSVAGQQFAYVVMAGAVRRKDLFAWNHEDDSRT